MQKRTLGRTGLELSLVGLGGVVVCDRPQAEADREVAWAIDQGVTYFDVAPQYGDAQQRMGPALRPYRDQCVLACKTLERTADAAAAELDDSLTKLCTDRFDIYQMHALSGVDEVETALGPGGAIETFLEAKAQGKVRFIGFSAHDEAAALRAIDSGHFDTVLYPLNYVTYTAGCFGPAVLDAARERGMGVMALKAMARTKVAEGEARTREKCWYVPELRPGVGEKLLRWTLSLAGVSAAVPPGDPVLFRAAVAYAQRFEPTTDAQAESLAGDLIDAEPIFEA